MVLPVFADIGQAKPNELEETLPNVESLSVSEVGEVGELQKEHIRKTRSFKIRGGGAEVAVDLILAAVGVVAVILDLAALKIYGPAQTLPHALTLVTDRELICTADREN
uniref:Uncharacterized protein n=1 Tax=Glossina brevipalpis TaxID=37001 RepID=A0A1A9X2Q0_9MUSC